MIDFELNEEQKAAVDMAHEFALNELRPIALECDRKGEFPGGELLARAAAVSVSDKSLLNDGLKSPLPCSGA